MHGAWTLARFKIGRNVAHEAVSIAVTWYATRAEHHAAYARIQMLEMIDKYREPTLPTRQTINAIINNLNS